MSNVKFLKLVRKVLTCEFDDDPLRVLSLVDTLKLIQDIATGNEESAAAIRKARNVNHN